MRKKQEKSKSALIRNFAKDNAIARMQMGYKAIALKAIAKTLSMTLKIAQAAHDTIPHVAPLFWSFRLMVGLGFYFIAFFALAFWLASRQQLDRYRGFLKLAFWSLPLPWVAIEAGWLIAEYGRQPWIIDGVLPTFLAASGLKLHQIMITLSGFVLIYTVLAIVEVWLMRKLILKGPEHLAAPAPDTPSPQPALAG